LTQFSEDNNHYSKSMKSRIQKQKREQLKKQIGLLLIVGLIAGMVVNCFSIRLTQEMSQLNQTSITMPKHQEETNIKEDIKKVEDATVDDMGVAIKNASKEFNVPEWLLLGIANAESGMGKYFYKEYDRDNCHNWWGLKGGNMVNRNDGSYLRCFVDESAGARTMAKTLRNYYLDEGKDDAMKICQKWIGAKFANKKDANGLTHCTNWVSNVNKYKNL